MPQNAAVIAGRVRGPDARPVAQARVYFLDGPAPFPDVAALTGEDGTFTLAAPAPGTYTIGCAAEGFATTTIQAASGETSLEIVLGT